MIKKEERTPLVTICCVTYNHESYIQDALDGFLMQNTEFEYEILIHDDCSTDNTTAIVRDYANRYPDKIRLIYQEENQYSKGVDILATFLYPEAKGKYIAICEGDDYWIDETKLQKQVEILEQNPDYSMCAHAGYMLNMQTNTKEVYPKISENRQLSMEELLEGGGNTLLTASYVMKTADLLAMPTWMRTYSFDDYQIFLYAGAIGKVYYLSQPMCVYRYMVAGSWSSMTYSSDQANLQVELDNIDLLKKFDDYTKRTYHKKIQSLVLEHEFHCHLLNGTFERLREEKYQTIYKKLGKKAKVMYRIGERMPKLYYGVRKVKHALIHL